MKADSEESQHPESLTLARAITFGVIGSLAGMLAMDVVMVAESLIIGEPATSYLALIGSVLGGGAGLGLRSDTRSTGASTGN